MSKLRARQPIQPVHRKPKEQAVLDWPLVEDDLLRTLPPILRAVVKALGFSGARDFLEEHGGVNVWIPQFKETAYGRSAQELARLRITLEPHIDATRRVTLPKVDKLFLSYRNLTIQREHGRMSAPQLAKRYKLTSRHITNILAGDVGIKPQMAFAFG
jgi:hypothetical protein